jgi:hypothetical protein
MNPTINPSHMKGNGIATVAAIVYSGLRIEDMSMFCIK